MAIGRILCRPISRRATSPICPLLIYDRHTLSGSESKARASISRNEITTSCAAFLDRTPEDRSLHRAAADDVESCQASQNVANGFASSKYAPRTVRFPVNNPATIKLTHYPKPETTAQRSTRLCAEALEATRDLK